MRRRILVAVAFVGVGIWTGSGDASAGTGCSAQDDLVTVQQAIAAIDTRNYSAEDIAALPASVAAADKNGDGLLCVKKFEPNNGQDKKRGAGYSATMINDNRLGGNG